jgi:hypothetical protein
MKRLDRARRNAVLEGDYRDRGGCLSVKRGLGEQNDAML